MSQQAIGFGRGLKEGEDEEAIKKMFTPEFRNRLDTVIPFASLSPEIIAKVVEKWYVFPSIRTYRSRQATCVLHGC